MEDIETTLMKNINEFQCNRGEMPTGIYLGHSQWLDFKKTAEIKAFKMDLTNAEPLEFMGIELFKVDRDSHFKVA